MWTRLLPRSIRRQRRKSPPVPRRQRCALAQRHRGCAAGGGEEARSSGHRRCGRRWCDVCCGQSLGDEAASDKAGSGATAKGPRSPDAADDAQGVVDPSPREDEAAVVCGGWEADMKDAPPPIHGSNSAAAACPFPLLLLLAAAAAVPTLSSGCK
ncbi:hypothetical protein TcBrA4_0032200 [Trypanosoma cruzi]|nr:hypothetical protein TcBrA4_0032200 [Trypanosoma cruzi]